MKQKESKVYGGHQVNSYLPLVSYRGQNRLKDNGLNLIMLIVRQWLNNHDYYQIDSVITITALLLFCLLLLFSIVPVDETVQP